jgi:hypothetical protein
MIAMCHFWKALVDAGGQSAVFGHIVKNMSPFVVRVKTGATEHESNARPHRWPHLFTGQTPFTGFCAGRCRGRGSGDLADRHTAGRIGPADQ